MDSELLTHQRTWHRTTPNGEQLTWKQIKQLAKNQAIRDRGFFEGQSGYPDAKAARRAIRYLKATFDDLAAIVLIRDQDDEPERRDGLEQARSEHHGPPVVILGLAIVEREAWVISGFEPQNEDERTRLDTERQTLGFYPHERSHDLTACKDDTAPRSPKRVLRALTEGQRDRERQCWIDTPLSQLRERGKHNGLEAYLDQVRKHLAALIGHVERENIG